MTSTVNITNPQKTGWLSKQSRYLKQWKQRYFVLQDNILYTFKNDKILTNPTEIIDLNIFSSIKSTDNVYNKQHTFDIYSSDMSYSICADNEATKEEW